MQKPEIEDLLRDTLIKIAKEDKDLRWDISTMASTYPKMPILSVFKKEIPQFSKYKLAKAFLRWTRDHEAADLHSHEIDQYQKLIEAINSALK